MIIEDSFLNLGWICINEIEKSVLLGALDLKIDRLINWDDGCELLNNSLGEKIFLNFQIRNWEFIVGKYFFSDDKAIKNVMNELSLKSKEVNSFAIDVWSNFYCYSKSVSGLNIRFWNESDEGIISEGNILIEESEILEKETANKILELANKTTVRFEQIEEFLSKNKVEILK